MACSDKSKQQESKTRMEEDDNEEMIAFGVSVIVKRRQEIPDDLYSDVKYIFHSSYLPLLDDDFLEILSQPSPALLFSERKLNEFEKQLDLPRRLPSVHDLSENSLIVVFQHYGNFGVMVFLIDWCEKTENVSMFHVFTKRFEDMGSAPRTIGYAAIGEKLYIFGGIYGPHPDIFMRVFDTFEQLRLNQEIIEDESGINPTEHPLWLVAEEKVQKTVPEHLNVLTYNLRTRAWETSNTPCLNGPKPNPIVFVYEGKIFALSGHPTFVLQENSPPFEFLDTNCPIDTPPCWSELPAPPIDMKYYKYHFLDEASGIFFLFFESRSDYSYETSIACCQLNLKEKPYGWSQNENNENDPKSKSKSVSSHNPDPIYPGSSVGLGMMHISEIQSHGCTVDNILFSYVDGWEYPKPVIIAQYVGCDKISFKPWVIDGLEEVLAGKVDTSLSNGFLNHIGNYRFCLIITYDTGYNARTDALYSLIFDLVKKDLPNEFQRLKDCDGSKAQKASKFNFVLKPVADRAFQVPTGFMVNFCKNL